MVSDKSPNDQNGRVLNKVNNVIYYLKIDKSMSIGDEYINNGSNSSCRNLSLYYVDTPIFI